MERAAQFGKPKKRENWQDVLLRGIGLNRRYAFAGMVQFLLLDTGER